MDLASVLPLAFVMIAGPQIITAFFFATSEQWKRESAAYVLGALLSITLVVTIGFLLANKLGGGGDDDSTSTVDWIVVALLLYAMVHNYRGRKESEPPKWMGRLQSATPKMAFVLGFLLLGFFPSDLVTSLSVGGRLGGHGDPWWYALPFVFLAIFFLALPALGVLLLGDRAERVLPRVRDWMNDNSWIVSEIVLALFIVLVIG